MTQPCPVAPRRFSASSRGCRVLAVSMLAATLWGCPSEDKTPAKTPQVGQQARDTEMAHESCDLGSSNIKRHTVDEQGPVVISVMGGAGETCRAVDLNRDGVIDVFVYFDDAGRERRRESAFGRDGMPNEVSIFEGGVLVRKERETNHDARIDTWDFYQGGRLVREERDSTGDGYIDQWWTFNRPDRPECAVVMSDANGDGKADEASRIDMCADGPGAPAAKPKSDKGKDPSKDNPGKDNPGKDDPGKDKSAAPSGTDSAGSGDRPASPSGGETAGQGGE